MTIRYPSGQQPPNAGRAGQPIVAPHSSSFAKRGMSLEKEINDANRYYLATEQAVIYKKPTPIQLVKVDYPKRSAAVVKEAYFKRPRPLIITVSTRVTTSILTPRRPGETFFSTQELPPTPG